MMDECAEEISGNLKKEKHSHVINKLSKQELEEFNRN